MKQLLVVSTVAAALSLGGTVLHAQEKAQQIFLKMLKSKEADERAKAAFNLGNYKSPEVVTALIGALQDKSRSVRANAATALHNIGKPEATAAEAPLRAALKDPEAIVRVKAAEALYRFGVPSSELLPVVKAALSERDNQVKIDAVKVWLHLKGEPGPAVEALGTALHDPIPAIRGDAAMAFGKFDHIPPEGLALLKEATKDKDSHVRGFATAQLGAPSATPAGGKSSASGASSGTAGQVPTLVASLKDKNSGVRKDAADSLRRLGKAAAPAVPDLVAALSDGSSEV